MIVRLLIAVIVGPFELLGVFAIDVWQSGLRAALRNIGSNCSRTVTFVRTGGYDE